jgi:hypothetical protein
MKNFIELAAEAAHELEQESEGNKETEFLAWLHVALQRESMVAVAYQKDRVKAQLNAWAEEKSISTEVVDIVLRAFIHVWAQERGHQKYFETVLQGIDPPEEFMAKIEQMLLGIRGRIEGAVLSDAMSKSHRRRLRAKIAITLGKTMKAVPEYVGALHEAKFSTYCSVNADLEQTAVAGYERMIELARQSPDAKFMKDTPVYFDLLKTCEDERFHEDLFRTFGGWPPGAPPAGTGPSISPMGPSSVSSETMTVADARGIIARAMTHAYGPADAQKRGNTVISVNEELIFRDPLVQHLRKFVRQQVKVVEKPDYLIA